MRMTLMYNCHATMLFKIFTIHHCGWEYFFALLAAFALGLLFEMLRHYKIEPKSESSSNEYREFNYFKKG